MTITIQDEGLKIFNEFLLASEADPETMADVLAYNPDNFATGISQLIMALNNARKK